MIIWKSEDPKDCNLYCFYDDLRRLSGNTLPSESDLDYDSMSNIFFGIGKDPFNHQSYLLCQADGIMWIFENFPSARDEIELALGSIGLTLRMLHEQIDFIKGRQHG